MSSDMTPIDASAHFDLLAFLSGETRGHGLFQDRFGRVRQRFTLTMRGQWDGAAFVLDEAFRYNDGRAEQRTWRVEREADGRFVGRCGDVIGLARGMHDEQGSRMRYKFRLRMKTRSLVIDCDDRVYLIDGRTAINRIDVRKWGIRLGSILVCLTR